MLDIFSDMDSWIKFAKKHNDESAPNATKLNGSSSYNLAAIHLAAEIPIPKSILLDVERGNIGTHFRWLRVMYASEVGSQILDESKIKSKAWLSTTLAECRDFAKKYSIVCDDLIHKVIEMTEKDKWRIEAERLISKKPAIKEISTSIGQVPEMTDQVNVASNIILYGPPGTGKTYHLQKLFDKYTENNVSGTKEEFLEKLVSDMTWWQVIAVSLLDGPLTVSSIFATEIVQTKVRTMYSRNARATIWGNLQMHTVSECEHVKYANRQEPLLFKKNTESVWSLDSMQIERELPELVELKHELNN